MNFPTGVVRWGIIGCGAVCEVKSGPALQKAARSSLSAVMRRNGDLARDFAERHAVERWYDDADALIADETVDAIYVATPPDSHEAYTLKALAAGKPVYCEKPMALTLQACDRMADAARQAGIPLITAYYRRALPRFERMRELIQDGTIGTPRAVVANQFRRASDVPGEAWKLDPAVSGGGHFADMYPHALDWLDHTFGPASEIVGTVRNQSGVGAAEDLVSFSMNYGDVALSGLCSYASDRNEDHVTVIGSEGSISMGFFAPSPVTLRQGDQEQVIDLPDPPHVHQPMVERAVAHLLDGAPNPCDPATARRSVEVMNAIYSAGS